VEFANTIPTREGGAAILDDLLESAATAIMGYNDLMMLGVLQAATARGVAIPGRLSLVGFDDIFGSDFTVPALTTIRSPLAEAGRRAVRAVLGIEDSHELLPTELVVRDSTGARA
jgi:LacI family transcriptional regulator